MRTRRSRAGSASVLISSAKRLGVFRPGRPTPPRAERRDRMNDPRTVVRVARRGECPGAEPGRFRPRSPRVRVRVADSDEPDEGNDQHRDPAPGTAELHSSSRSLAGSMSSVLLHRDRYKSCFRPSCYRVQDHRLRFVRLPARTRNGRPRWRIGSSGRFVRAGAAGSVAGQVVHTQSTNPASESLCGVTGGGANPLAVTVRHMGPAG